MARTRIVSAPEPTLRRLPRYLHLLYTLRTGGIAEVSSTFIASELHSDATQVRKDIEFTNIVGHPKTGYIVEELIEAIEVFLSWDSKNYALLAGAGNLGTAMLGYPNFKKYGLIFLAAFDSDEKKIGTKIHDIPVFKMSDMPQLVKEWHIQTGVITVPSQNAQQACDLMVSSGIRGIWNFAPIHLKVPAGVILENSQVSQSLAVLSHKLAVQRGNRL